MGEICPLLGRQRALWLQASVFSLVQTRFNLPPLQLLGLLAGVLQRGRLVDPAGRALDNAGNCTGLTGLSGASPNPIGGLVGWLKLGGLLWMRRRLWSLRRADLDKVTSRQ
jgi:hypothetical protein